MRSNAAAIDGGCLRRRLRALCPRCPGAYPNRAAANPIANHCRASHADPAAYRDADSAADGHAAPDRYAAPDRHARANRPADTDAHGDANDHADSAALAAADAPAGQPRRDGATLISIREATRRHAKEVLISVFACLWGFISIDSDLQHSSQWLGRRSM
jgi:hypothetical protein